MVKKQFLSIQTKNMNTHIVQKFGVGKIFSMLFSASLKCCINLIKKRVTLYFNVIVTRYM